VKHELDEMEEPVRFEWVMLTAEIDSLAKSIKSMESLVANDKVAAFTQSMGAFLKEAQEKMAKLQDTRKKVTELCVDLGNWLSEQKVDKEPEKLFALIGTFIKALENADNFNNEAVARAEKQKKREEKKKAEAEAKATGKPMPGKPGTKPGSNVGGDKGKGAQRRRFVDDVEEGIGQGRVKRHGAGK